MRRFIAAGIASAIGLSVGVAFGAPAEAGPRIAAGVLELGLAGSTVTIEGSTQATLAVRFGAFVAAPRGLAGFEAETGWTRMRDYDALDLLGASAWSGRMGAGPVHPFVGVIGGVRQEWMGSFRQSRFPVGAAVGARILVTEDVAVRAEWRGLRVLDDPMDDPFENHVVLGLSVLFGP